MPEDVVRDRGPQFTARFCMRVTLSLASGYHPQSKVQCKCINQDIRWALLSYSHNQSDWYWFVLLAEYAQNLLFHTYLCLPPLKIPVLGRLGWLWTRTTVWDTGYRYLGSFVNCKMLAAASRQANTPTTRKSSDALGIYRKVKLDSAPSLQPHPLVMIPSPEFWFSHVSFWVQVPAFFTLLI